MAKFMRVPEGKVESSSSSFLADPQFFDYAAVGGLTLLATVFVILLLRGVLASDKSRPRSKPAAMSGNNYGGMGFGNKPKKSTSPLRQK